MLVNLPVMWIKIVLIMCVDWINYFMASNKLHKCGIIELRNYLLRVGFLNSTADSLFVYTHGHTLLYMLVYVDDIVIMGNDNTQIEHIIAPQGLHEMQRKYTTDLFEQKMMLGAKPVISPMAPSPKLTLSGSPAMSDPTLYRATVGSIQYLAFTRSDIDFVVNKLSPFMHRPTEDDWQAVKRLLHYLAGTVSHNIFILSYSPLILHAYYDADWDGDPNDFVSTNAYIVYIGSTPISWSSKKQKGVSRSPKKAEYCAVSNAAAELGWLCSLLTEMHVQLPAAPVTMLVPHINVPTRCFTLV